MRRARAHWFWEMILIMHGYASGLLVETRTCSRILKKFLVAHFFLAAEKKMPGRNLSELRTSGRCTFIVLNEPATPISARQSGSDSILV